MSIRNEQALNLIRQHKPQLDELDRLRGIVRRLKHTDDGIPLVPGDECWVIASDRYDEISGPSVVRCKYMDPTDAAMSCWPYEAIDPANVSEEFNVLSVWSTREAAQAAKEGAK